MKHRGHEGLYWFGPPENKTLRPVVGVVLLEGTRCRSVVRMSSGGRLWPPYIVWRTRSVDLESRPVTTWNLSLVGYNNYPMISELLGGATDVLTCTPSLESASDKVVWRNLLEGLRDHRSGLLSPLSGRMDLLTGRQVF